MKKHLLLISALLSISILALPVFADNDTEPSPSPDIEATEEPTAQTTEEPIPTLTPLPTLEPTPVPAQDITDDVCYSNIAAYINGFAIPSYNINGSTAVYVKDLSNFGFTVTYDHETRSTYIKQDKTTIDGMDNVTLPWQENGTFLSKPGISGITVYANDTVIPAANVNGYMIVYLKSLKEFGRVSYSDELRKAFLNIDTLPEGSYATPPSERKPRNRKMVSQYDVDPHAFYNYSTERDDWGFIKNKGDEPSLYDWQKDVLASHSSYYMNHDKPRTIYLTFDEGYEAGNTPQILDVLEKYNVPATFFITGEFFKTAPDLVQDMIDRGFDVGNHTVNHANLAESSPADIIYEIGHLHDEVLRQFNYEMAYMRPPAGTYNERSLAVAEALGYSTIFWSFAYLDYDGVTRGADYAFRNVTPYIHDGAILLLHTMSADNANALEDIILYAMEQGYSFGSLDDFCFLNN